MTSPTFSVVMPARNAEETVGSAIRSVLAQRRRDFELIIVDDGSIDGTCAEVRKWGDDSRIRLLRQAHSGVASARNAAITAARGEFISMIDSDDLWMPSYLEAMGSGLRDHAEAAMAYTDAWVFHHASRQVLRSTAMAAADPPIPPPTEPSALLARLIRGNFIYNAVTIRKAAIDVVGPFNPSLPAASDYEMWLRVVAHGYRAIRPPGLLGLYRLRLDSISSNKVRQLTGLCQIYRMVSTDTLFPETVNRSARERLDECARELSVLTSKRDSVRTRFRSYGLGAKHKAGVLARRHWYKAPPDEVKATFPNLHEL